MQSTQDCVRDYIIEDYHQTLEIAKECQKEYNLCLDLPSRLKDKALCDVISKYNLKGSEYDSGKMVSDIYVLTIKRRHIEI